MLKKIMLGFCVWFTLGTMSSFNSVILPAYAHLDPPSPPAYWEAIVIASVVINDDQDTFAAGEINVGVDVQPTPPHVGAFVNHPPATATPRYVSVSAPPPVAVPLPPGGLLVWSHPNCEPIEPVDLSIIVIDEDVFGFDTAFGANVMPIAPGANAIATPQGGFSYIYTITPAPWYDHMCDGGGNIPEDTNYGNSFLNTRLAFVSPSSTISFTYSFTNLQDNKDNFSFKVSGQEVVVDMAKLNTTTLLGIPKTADPSWFEWEDTEVGSGIELNPLQSVSKDLKVHVPSDTPDGYYVFSVEGVSLSKGFAGPDAQALGILEVGKESRLGLSFSRTFQINAEGKSFDIMVTGEGISSVTLNQEKASLTLENDGTEGRIEVEIPKELLDGELTVISAGRGIEFTLLETGTDSVLIFDKPAGSKKLTIEGTTVIPEFSFLMIVLFGAIGIILFYSILYRGRLIRDDPTISNNNSL